MNQPVITWACGLPQFVLGLVLGLTAAYLVYAKRRNNSLESKDLDVILHTIKTRRTITPKNFNGEKLSSEEMDYILEAANWAPTHKKTEPWRYTIFVGCESILDYLDFIDNWYRDHSEDVSLEEMEGFRNKIDGIRREWPDKVSHLMVIGMKRGEGLPEWEELCSVAMSVQNMHLVVTAQEDVGGFWSSHTWCQRARDSPEMRQFVGLREGSDGDRILGAFVLGKVDPEKKKTFKSSRDNMKLKIQWKL